MEAEQQNADIALPGGTIKTWITSLSDTELRRLLRLPGPLPLWAQVAGSRRNAPLRIGQRELVTVRVRLRRATARELKEIADAAARFAMHRLQHCGGYSEQACADPGPEELEAMVGFLEPVHARLMLYALHADSGPMAESVSQNWERLLAAVDRPEEMCRCHRGETGCDGLENSVEPENDADAPPETTEEEEGLAEIELPAPDVDVLADLVRSLREHAAAVAEGLAQAADRVRAGLGLDEGELDEAAAWLAERAALADRIAAVGTAWSMDEGFARLETVIGRLRAEAEAEVVRADELALKISQRQQLLALIAQAGQGGGAFIDQVRDAVQTLNGEIASLGGDAAPQQPRTDGIGAAAVAAADPGDAPFGENINEVFDDAAASLPATQHSSQAPTASVEEDLSADRHTPSRRPIAQTPSPVVTAPAPVLSALDREAAENAALEPDARRNGESRTAHLVWRSAQGEDTGEAPASPVEWLVARGRFQEAYWFTAASAEPSHRAECLAFADAAFSCDRAEEATVVMTRFAPDLRVLRDDHPALILAAVASVRAGLVVGWPNDLLLQTDPTASLTGPWGGLLKCGADLLRRYQRLDSTTLQADSVADATLSKAAIAQAADTLRLSLGSKKTPYARATQVQRRLIVAEQPLGKALTAVREWATGQADASALDDAWENFRKRDFADRIIEEADAAIRTPRQAKEPIEAKAKRSLLSRIDEVVTLLSQARALAAPENEELGDAAAALRRAVDRTMDVPAPSGPEGAALLRLRGWIRGEDSAAVPRRVLDVGEGESRPEIVPGAEALLAALDLPRSRDGFPQPDMPGFDEAAATLLKRVDIPAVLAGYAKRGDLHLADALVEALEQGRVPAAPEGIRALPPDWRALRDAEWARWSNLRRDAHRVAAGLLAELRTQALDEQTERELVGQLENLEKPAPDGAFRDVVEDIHRFEAQLKQRLDTYLDRLYERLDSLVVSEQDRKRLVELLRSGDTVTAEECLALLREGGALPDWSELDWGDELAQFMEGLEQDCPSKAGLQGCSARPWAESYADKPLTEGSRSGLESWDALCVPTTRGSQWQKHVPTVLRTLGLEGRPPARLDGHPQVRGVLWLTARLAVSESVPGHVAALGSAATTYTILVVSDEQRGRSPLELLRNESGACIILYLYPLGLAGRRAMAAQARTSAQQALVVDPAVFGWAAARSPRSFRATQRVTLPWTAFTPYTPYVAGLVPPEVFYGRNEELATVVDPLGALFLYGGRQLGKSALLRKVEASFPVTQDRKAVYLDLKARGVGEAEPADRVWSVLSAELKRVGVLSSKVSSEVNAGVVIEHVRRWLGENRERRVLVLADEADAFLMADSKAVHGKGGDVTFANVSRLKGLMDDTDRRFKVVFAGLHQVQRFSHLSNVPLAHGAEMRIGPLKPTEAQRLVVAPMAAFGYRFESPNLVWRVLAATNYQACLVQIFCDRLIAALREKPVGSAHWPITITDEDIRAVVDSAQVHRSIADRLRITINLEDRYRVLALVIALRSHSDRFQQGYDSDALLSEAKRHWPDGFNMLTANDVKIYLDEMVGLGLLVETHRGTYAVRSPNVVRMLGTREDLELELRQTEFSLPYDYNPRFSRRLVGNDPHGVARYSPLTEQQLYEATSPGVTVVCLTRAHGPQLVTDAIKSYADARGLAVHARGLKDKEIVRVLAQDARSKQPSVIVADMRTCGREALGECLTKLHVHTSRDPGAPHRSAILVVDPMTWSGFEHDQATRVLRPERWNADSLHAWPECPFDTADKRRRLADATGGWPQVVERTIHFATRGGATPEAALEQVAGYFAEYANATKHLESVELDQDVIALLSAWTEYVEPGEGCNYADIAAVTNLELDDVRRLMDRLVDHGVLDEGEGGYALDPLTFRALSTVRRGV